jgi:hypothetical protein
MPNSITGHGNTRKALTIGSIDKENNIPVFGSGGFNGTSQTRLCCCGIP